MKKTLMIIMLVCIASMTWAGNLMLVEFSTDSYDSTLVWLAKIVGQEPCAPAVLL